METSFNLVLFLVGGIVALFMSILIAACGVVARDTVREVLKRGKDKGY